LDFDAVEVRDVSRNFGRRRALSHVTLTCTRGEILGLLGPNGAGKSTLIAILATLTRPSSGDVLYGRQTAGQGGDALRARIGVLGHDLFLYGDLSAEENLEFFARLYGLAAVPARVDAALQQSRLTDRRADRVAAFSRGQRQRLALERALIHEPRLVLLDEPFTGLDDESAALLIERLRGLRAQGTIVVMATHDFETADGLLDRAICLVNGRAAAIDVHAADAGSLRQRYRAATREARS